MKRIPPALMVYTALLLLAPVGPALAADASSLPVQLQLIWATNDPKSPDARHKPVEPTVMALFEHMPYKWKYYFEVNRIVANVPSDRSLDKLEMSKHCALDIKYLGKDHMQVKLYGDGKLVSIHKESLPLLLAGPSQGDTAWFVLIRKALPGASVAASKSN